MGMCIIFWYVLSYVISTFTGTTLSNLIIGILSIPLKVLISTPGMFVIMFVAQLCWFFGIHGTSVVFAVIMLPYIQAYSGNAALAAAGQPLVYNPVFLYGAMAVWGGAGNTLPLVIMGLKSKSTTIRTICKASLIPNIFGINEPVIFGMPIMYNATLMIPFFLQPVVVGILYAIVYKLGLIGYPQVLLMTTLPVGLSTFMTTLDFKLRHHSFCCYSLYVICSGCHSIKSMKQMLEVEAKNAAEAAE